jgi:uncharacterized membrane protein
MNENPLFNIVFFGGFIMILAGFVMYKFPPKKINPFYGYKTPSSMESQEKWDFAQYFASKQMMKLGFLLAMCNLVSFITDFDYFTNTFIGLGLIVISVLVLLYNVEKAIKMKFN